MDPDLEEALRLRPVYRWHIPIVLRDGERVYLNLLQSETVRRSRITAGAAAKLGRESKEDGCTASEGCERAAADQGSVPHR
jgi:hypothetical protein